MVFLSSGNGLQMQTEAGLNGGCGIVNIPELKTGKGKLTDGVGSYGPLLSFYDDIIPGTTFRKADTIEDMENCRIQVVAAGVVDDWVDFVKKAGSNSGALARVVPVLGWDRQMIRLQQEKMSPYSFSLQGIKDVLSILEERLAMNKWSDEPPLILTFSPSTLLSE